MFEKYRADLVKRKIQEHNLPVPEELISAYDAEAERAQQLWKVVEADKANAKPKTGDEQNKQTGKKKGEKTTDKGKSRNNNDNAR